MGRMYCDLHGWSGVAAITPSAIPSLDGAKTMNSIILVELVFDEVSWFVHALEDDLPFQHTTLVGQLYQVDDEKTLDEIYEKLVYRCAKCVNQALTRG